MHGSFRTVTTEFHSACSRRNYVEQLGEVLCRAKHVGAWLTKISRLNPSTLRIRIDSVRLAHFCLSQ